MGNRWLLLAGAILGFLSVALGASAEHLLRARADEEGLRFVMTAIRYHQIGALVVTAIGLALLCGLVQRLHRGLAVAGWLLAGGTVLFSFSIYLAVTLDLPGLTYITPFGGITLLAGWAALARVGWLAGRTGAGRTGAGT